MFKIINTNNILTIEDGNQKYGPYASYPDMQKDIYDNDLEIMYEPKDLIFDIWVEDEEANCIHLDSKAYPGYDNLGGHNVTGLPYGLDAEDMECCWSVEDISKEQIIKDMIALGFTHVEYLNQDQNEE